MGSRLSLLLLLALCVASGFFVGRAFWSASSPAPSVGARSSRVPAFELKDLSGERRSISEWTSQALIINFWATWCAPCRREMPLLQTLHQERSGAEGPAIVGVAIDDPDPVRVFVGETGVTYPILVGQQDAMAAAEAFEPQQQALPLTVIAAPGGEILDVHVGALHREDLARIVGVLDRLESGRISLAQAREALQKPT